MLGSQGSLSRKGPLGAVWVAAYCFKKLKKAQISQTHIPSSVDKILQDEFDAVTYRVLSYLLLGIVKIYSKKVDYMFSDCNNILLKIKEFLVSNKDGSTPMETLCAPNFAITLPKRFELDAFDLEILDDTSRSNLVPREEITLKDSKWKSKGEVQYSLDQYHFEQFGAYEDIFTHEYSLNEDARLSDLMDFDMEVSTSLNVSNSQASMEKLQHGSLSQHQPVDIKTDPVKSSSEFHRKELEHTRAPEMVDSDEMCVEVSMKKLWDDSFYEEAGVNIEMFSLVQDGSITYVKHAHEHQQTDAEQVKVPDTVQSANEINMVTEEDHNPCDGEASIENSQENMLSDEDCMNNEMCCVFEEPATPAKPVNVDQQTDGEWTKVPDMVQSKNEMNKVTNVGHNPCDGQTSIENLRDKKFSQEPCINNEMFCVVEEPLEHARPSGEEQQSEAESIQVAKMMSSVSGKYMVVTEDQPFSTTPNAISETKLLDVSGISTPEVIPTPANKEYARIPRKRKCFLDDVIIFSNDFIMRQIEDSSGLVSKRRKAPRTALAAWKSHCMSNLHHSFLEPLIPYSALELRSLFCKKKLKIPESVEALEPPQMPVPEPSEKLDILELHTAVRSKKTVDHLEKLTILESPGTGRIVEAARSPEKLDMPKSPTACGSSEQIPIAPETPILCKTTLRFQSPEGPQFPHSDKVIPDESIEREPSPSEDQQHEFNQPSPDEDQQLNHNLMNEVINLCGEDNEDHYGWSERTRMVARLMQRSFLTLARRKEKELVNFSRLLEGKSKKESAIIFYEMLVLKSKEYVHVKQENSYGDILVWKTSQWHEACGARSCVKVL